MNIDYRKVDISSIKSERIKDFLELRSMFNIEDPMGFFRIKGVMPINEYDPEIATVLLQIEETNSLQDLHELIYREFTNWFDENIIGLKGKYYGLAVKMYAWKISRVEDSSRDLILGRNKTIGSLREI